MFPATYKHYIFNLPQADTFSGTEGVRLRQVRLYSHVAKSFSHEKICTWSRFETEAKGNSETVGTLDRAQGSMRSSDSSVPLTYILTAEALWADILS